MATRQAADSLGICFHVGSQAMSPHAYVQALDRVLRAGHYWIPNWHSANHRVAYWDMFGWKEPKPDYFFPVERLWWFDAKKARAIGKA